MILMKGIMLITELLLENSREMKQISKESPIGEI